MRGADCGLGRGAAGDAATRSQRALGGAAPPARLAVIGMGRLGGGGAGLRQRRGRAVRLRAASTGRRTTRPSGTRRRSPRRSAACSAAPSPDPPLVVDADLRPEGRQGPLVRTLGSYREYYARWSEAWEAQALLRARPRGRATPSSGGGSSSWSTRSATRRTGSAPATVTEIRRIKARVDAERLPRGADREHAHQARPRRARRRRVDRAAAAAPARRRRPRAAHDLDAGRAARGRRGGPAHRTTTPRSWPRAGGWPPARATR